MAMKKNLREYTREDLEELLVPELTDKKFVVKQIYDWLWKKHTFAWERMTNVSRFLREKLAENFVVEVLKISKKEDSSDGTIKVLFSLPDGKFVEGVLIPSDKRKTACISVQVGCSLDCAFCATGQLKMQRNLRAWEIYDQVRLLNDLSLENFGEGLTNIVVMGMGEPLLNFKQLLAALDLLTDSDLFFGFSARKITVSTSGIVKKIKEFAEIEKKYKLAISLHATTENSRSELMSINKTNDLKKLKEAIRYYYQKKRLPVTYEYVLLEGINDTQADAKRLAKIARMVPSKVNIIEFNPVSGIPLRKSKRTDVFASWLHSYGVRVTVRRSRGKDINAACGQLALQSKTI